MKIRRAQAPHLALKPVMIKSAPETSIRMAITSKKPGTGIPFEAIYPAVPEKFPILEKPEIKKIRAVRIRPESIKNGAIRSPFFKWAFLSGLFFYLIGYGIVFPMKLSKIIYHFGFFFILMFPAVSSQGFAGDSQTVIGHSQVEILSPKPDELLPADEEVKITYQLAHGLQDNGDHVHVYLDGENAGTSKKSPRSLGKLSPGKHTVVLKVSNHEHEMLNIEVSVQFEVSSAQLR
jgi:hypothetical protein